MEGCWFSCNYKGEKILLLRRASNSLAFPGYWTFPSGCIEEYDESISNTVIREVKEETGLDFRPKKWNFYESIVNNKRCFALVYFGDWSGTIYIQSKEVSDYGFFTYKKTLSMNLAFAYHQVLKDLYNEKIIV